MIKNTARTRCRVDLFSECRKTVSARMSRMVGTVANLYFGRVRTRRNREKNVGRKGLLYVDMCQAQLIVQPRRNGKKLNIKRKKKMCVILCEIRGNLNPLAEKKRY